MPPQTSNRRPSERDTNREQEFGIPPERLFALFEAEYTEDILETLGDRPMAARELVRKCDASRATVYRRLNALQSAGLVAETMAYDPDGHHRTVYRATVDRIEIALTEDGLSVTATRREANTPETTRSPAED